MKILAKLANIFLILVGIEYIIFGLMAALGLGLFSVMGANSIYVAPMQPIEMALDLSRVGCEGFFGTENCSPEATAQSQYITLALGIGALIGGIAGLLGGIDIWKGKKIGYKIWAVLVLISILTVIWNWVWASAMYSSIWALLYLLSFIAVWKVKQNETI